MSKTAKQLAAELLFQHTTGMPPQPRRPLSKPAQQIADLVAGIDRPEPGTPAAELATLRQQPVQPSQQQPSPVVRSVPSTEMEQMVEKLAEEKLEAWLRSNGYRIEEE